MKAGWPKSKRASGLWFLVCLTPGVLFANVTTEDEGMIRKLKSGEYRLYSRKKDLKSGKRRNLGTFHSREAAQKHERAVQYFKRQ